MIYTWRGILCHESSVDSPSQAYPLFVNALSMWTDISKCLSIPTSNELEATLQVNSSRFLSANTTIQCLSIFIPILSVQLTLKESLADFFGLREETRLQIHTYKLILHITKCLLPPQHAEFTNGKRNVFV
jgi:hypothetical protein